MEDEKKKVEVVPKLVKINPLKDHDIKQNAFYYDLKKGVSCEVAEHFIAALKSEKVIN